jgi:hypothetical protein
MGNREKVISREYKIMLRADRFNGDEAQAIQIASQFWHQFAEAIKDQALAIEGDLTTVDKRRTIRFYDTQTTHLRQSDYVFRERCNVDTGEREVTLKFRHPDRYIAQDRNMDADRRDSGKSKFEEDIKPPFIKLYSFSTKQPVDDSYRLRSLQDSLKLYPGLAADLDGLREDDHLQVVGDFTAYELVLEGGTFQVRNDPREDAECALVLWYDQGEKDDTPVVAEFSFKYEDPEESFSAKAAHRAYRVFEVLQTMNDWVDPASKTKTAYVYDRQALVKA